MHTFYYRQPIKSNHRPSMKLVCCQNILFVHFDTVTSYPFTLNWIQRFNCLWFAVLGAGGNTFNEIRRQRQSQPLTTKRMNSFLSSTDVMPLTVRILKSGNISVAITGQLPFLTAFDPNVLDIKYISFRFE